METAQESFKVKHTGIPWKEGSTANPYGNRPGKLPGKTSRNTVEGGFDCKPIWKPSRKASR